MKKVIMIGLCILLVAVAIYIKTRKEYYNNLPKKANIEEYSDIIESDNIVYFEYTDPNYYVECKLTENGLNIISRGGYSDIRDNKTFKLDYETDSIDLLNKLQNVVKKYQLSTNNGSNKQINGLKEATEKTLSITYDTGEKIYHNSNAERVISEEAALEIYELFHEEALANGYDFTTDKSNEEIYDDATVDYLQGTWSGTHFNDNIKVVFNNNHVKIYVNDKITDDVDYVIFNGNVRVNKLVKDTKAANSEYDYEMFNGVAAFKKKNDILLTAYFTKNEYSTCELLKETK